MGQGDLRPCDLTLCQDEKDSRTHLLRFKKISAYICLMKKELFSYIWRNYVFLTKFENRMRSKSKHEESLMSSFLEALLIFLKRPRSDSQDTQPPLFDRIPLRMDGWSHPLIGNSNEYEWPVSREIDKTFKKGSYP